MFEQGRFVKAREIVSREKPVTFFNRRSLGGEAFTFANVCMILWRPILILT